MESILETLIEQDFGLEINSPKWARSKMHDSLVINRDLQVFHWNSEGIAGNALTYLIKVRKISPRKAKEYLQNFAGYKDTFIVEVNETSETIVYPKLIDVFSSEMWNFDDRGYWKDRHITDDTLRRFQVGKHGDFYTVPLFEGGVLKQFHLRRDHPKVIRHYYKNVGPILFNQDVIRYKPKNIPLFIVEGVTDVLAFQQLEIPAVCSSNGCEAFLKDWVRHFIGINEIIICYDNDKAGDTGSVRVAKILGEYRCKIYNFWDCQPAGYDGNDWLIDGKTKQQLLDTVELNARYSFEFEEPNKRYTKRKGNR